MQSDALNSILMENFTVTKNFKKKNKIKIFLSEFKFEALPFIVIIRMIICSHSSLFQIF